MAAITDQSGTGTLDVGFHSTCLVSVWLEIERKLERTEVGKNWKRVPMAENIARTITRTPAPVDVQLTALPSSRRTIGINIDIPFSISIKMNILTSSLAAIRVLKKFGKLFIAVT